jgi:hypothetical protein
VIKAGKYLPIGRLALAVVLIAASSGFTVVLHSCLMADMACCGTMAAGGAMQHAAGHSTSDAALVKDASSCCENTIVGGLSPTTATLESQPTSIHHKSALAVVSPELQAGQARASLSFITLRQFRPPDPPATGLYLSNAALLI